jgi:thiol-disulfide isomerase/thioredoxin
VACVGVVALCLGLVGCSAFSKRGQGTSGPTGRSGGGPPPADVADRAPPVSPVQRTSGPGPNGILAGQVLDSYNRRPPPTYIQVISSQDARDPKMARIEVAADGQGYFTIQGLQPGQHYQLIARAKDGDRVLAGSTWATPPDPKVLIRISEDFATDTTPPVPPAPSWPGPAAGDRAATLPPSPPKAAELGSPVPGADPASPPGNRVRPEAIANIPGPGSPAAPTPGLDPSPTPEVPGRVPSCSLVGKQLYNFALHDLTGQPWEYRRHRQGRLVLLDFSGFTWCVHCIQAIPHLNALQKQYGPYGLEVVGIVYEEGSAQEQIRKVERIARSKAVSYKLLLGGGQATCPVRAQFEINRWPTLVLLDENSRVVWRGEGLDGHQMSELDQLIRKKLGVR